MKRETIELSEKERDRLKLVQEVEHGFISMKDAAQAAGISYRQIKRTISRFRAEGDKGLVHRLRGRPSNRRTPKASLEKAAEIIRERYSGFGPVLAAEKLQEHGIDLSRETVRRQMIAEGLWEPRKRRDRHRSRRERRRCFGDMVQMDGSHHDWLEGRGARMVLIAMIDDATNRVIARFFPSESMEGLMGVMRIWLETFGRPRAIYADRHSLWVSVAGRAGDRHECDSTQLRRALRELGIDFITARSPQGKGRVERLFKTLQDRLVKEMRLDGIDNIDDANRFLEERYLPAHNTRFAVIPVSRADAHRRVGRALNLDLILCARHERVVANDYTVSWRSRVFQIGRPALPGMRGGKVSVAEKQDGTIEILFRGRKVLWKELDSRTYKSTKRHPAPRGRMVRSAHPPSPKSSKPWIPPPDHPWRYFRIRPS
jgi:transposase